MAAALLRRHPLPAGLAERVGGALGIIGLERRISPARSHWRRHQAAECRHH